MIYDKLLSFVALIEKKVNCREIHMINTRNKLLLHI